MSLYSTTQPAAEDGKRVLLGKIAQAVTDGVALLVATITGAIAAITAAITNPVVVTKVGPVISIPPSSPVKILEANPKRRRAVIRNMSGIAVVFLGDNTVNPSGAASPNGPIGFPLYTGTPINQPAPYSIFETNTTGELYGASTGAAVSVIEFLTE